MIVKGLPFSMHVLIGDHREAAVFTCSQDEKGHVGLKVKAARSTGLSAHKIPEAQCVRLC